MAKSQNSMNKYLTIFIITLFFLFTMSTPAFASEKLSGASATLAMTLEVTNEDNRVQILREYLEKYNSPLADSAQTFIEQADKNDLDWKFVAAIAGVESTFAHQLPYNSYNAWGWGIYGNNTHSFASYDDGIVTISKSLRERYMDTWGAKDVHEIGSFYASSPTWSTKVIYFMRDIERFEQQKNSKNLSLTI